MKSNIKAVLLGSFIGLLSVGSVHADTWSERETLAAVVTELESVTALIQSAKMKQDQRYSLQFNYDALESDLRKIREGIEHHLNAPMDPIVPSRLEAIGSSYIEKR